MSNPWEKNLGRLLVPQVFVDVDLMKGLIKSCNPSTKTFCNEDRSVLFCLDKNAIFKAFGMGGPMSKKIDIVNKRFK